MLLEGLDLFMDSLSKSKYIVALTGAGISTNAGIPDFRGPNGIYKRKDIPGEKIFEVSYFQQNPADFYKLFSDMVDSYANAVPTKGHLFLKKLEDIGRLKTVITQNIDGLHQKAGNTNVIEVHGSFSNFYCISCGKVFPMSEKIVSVIRKGNVPVCDTCKGTLKPDVVFFGEPVHGLEKALTEVQRADMLIALGTSLSVYPVATLPSYITDNTMLVIINAEPTQYDHRAKIVLHEDIDLIVERTKLL
jgi:NAD-dependent deacetylase